MKVILICCDGLRADHVTPEIMPNLTEVALEGARFDNCLSCGTHTLQSLTWFLTHAREYDPANAWTVRLSEKGVLTTVIHTNVLVSQFAEAFKIEFDVFKASRGALGTELRKRFRGSP